MNPWMTPGEQLVFAKYLDYSTDYFEFGSGGSTVWANLRENIKSIKSIESDPEYVKKIKELAPRADIQWVFIGNIKEGGHPVDKSYYENWQLYYNSYRDRKTDPDLILIDGRFRVACALTVCLYSTSSNITVLIHDFKIRPYYHILLNFFTMVEEIENLIVLKIKEKLDKTVIADTLIKYTDDTR